MTISTREGVIYNLAARLDPAGGIADALDDLDDMDKLEAVLNNKASRLELQSAFAPAFRDEKVGNLQAALGAMLLSATTLDEWRALANVFLTLECSICDLGRHPRDGFRAPAADALRRAFHIARDRTEGKWYEDG